MRIHKRSNTNRTIYCYTFRAPVYIDGKTQICFTLKPGENGVTEADIKMLQAEDDREVYYNNKNLRPGRTAEEKVKNTILEWTLKLKAEGIVGENMTFSKEEKVCAINIFQTVNNYYGNTSVINSPSDNVQIVSGSENTVSFSYGKVNLKSALVGLQDFLINTGANVAAGLIQAIMQGLF